MYTLFSSSSFKLLNYLVFVPKFVYFSSSFGVGRVYAGSNLMNCAKGLMSAGH